MLISMPKTDACVVGSDWLPAKHELSNTFSVGAINGQATNEIETKSWTYFFPHDLLSGETHPVVAFIFDTTGHQTHLEIEIRSKTSPIQTWVLTFLPFPIAGFPPHRPFVLQGTNVSGQFGLMQS